MATWPTIIDDDGSNTTGTVVNNANVWNPIKAYIDTPWVDWPYNAGYFQNWTVEAGDVITQGYVLFPTLITFVFSIQTASVASSIGSLAIVLPKAAIRTVQVPIVLANAGAWETGMCEVGAGSGSLYLYRPGFAAWSVATNTTYVRGEITFPY